MLLLQWCLPPLCHLMPVSKVSRWTALRHRHCSAHWPRAHAGFLCGLSGASALALQTFLQLDELGCLSDTQSDISIRIVMQYISVVLLQGRHSGSASST
mmetsp:Transcript_6898/g.25702  ORF Transcript_6898/g.25702 Transcript_6898/m.25702 type:complete len:99 (+) Transcript_6898:108-404(+)